MSKHIVEKKTFSAAEIVAMNLPGLPTTIANIHARAKKEEWFYETKVGLGGVRKMYFIPPAYLPGYKPYANEKPKPSLESEATRKAANIAAKAVGVLDEKIDSERLTKAICIVEAYLQENKLAVTAQRKGEVVVVLYKYMKSTEDEADLAQFLKLVA